MPPPRPCPARRIRLVLRPSTDVTLTTPAPTRATAYSQPVPYLPGLDGLRALAVIAVLVYHGNPSWLRGGFLGVEVFFVISGYLITMLLLSEHRRTGCDRGSGTSGSAGPGACSRRCSPCCSWSASSASCSCATSSTGSSGDLFAALTYTMNWHLIVG